MRTNDWQEFEVSGVYADLEAELARRGLVMGDTCLAGFRWKRTSAEGPDPDKDYAIWTVTPKEAPDAE